MDLKKWVNAGVYFCLMLLFTIPVIAQGKSETILPGSNKVSGKFIKPYTNKWKVTLILRNGNSRFYQVWTDSLQKTQLNGKSYLHRVQDIYDAEGNLVKTQMNFVEENTLRPVRASIVGTDGSYNFFEFDGKHVTGKYLTQRDSAKEVKIDKTFKSEVFDWSLYGILLAGLPLKVGFHATLPIYEFPNPEDALLNIDVKSKEMMTTLSGKKIETFKVETNQNLVFYISKEAPYVVNLVFQTRSGTSLVWEMY